MALEHIIDETATMPGADIEDIYDRCLQWIQTIPIHDLETTRSHSIQAHHKVRASSSVSIMFQHKKFTINLSEQGNNIEIHINIYKIPNFFDPPLKEKRNLYQMYWIDYVAHLWKYLGVDLRIYDLKRFYPIDNIKKRMIKRQNLYKSVGFSWLVIFLMAVLVDDGTPVLYRISLIFGLVIVSTGTLFMVSSVIPSYISTILKIQQNPWRLMKEIYPYNVNDSTLLRILKKMPI